MRFTGAVAVLFCALSAAATPAGDFPYTGFITGEDVYVRSGPGKSYYPTEKLKQGTEVEVWRHDPGGWYAVRPPKGSFSWVRARELKPGGQQGIHVVDGDRVIARVGSALRDVRDVIQIRLDRGEEVEVLETVGTGGEAWCKVAPPSGEFRWIFGRFVSPEKPAADDDGSDSRRNLLLPQPQPAEKPPARPAANEPKTIEANVGEVAAKDAAENNRSSLSPPRKSLPWKATASKSAARRVSDGAASRGEAQDTEVKTASFQRQEVIITPDSQPLRQAGLLPADKPQPHEASEPLSPLEQLDRRLAEMVAREASEWRLDELKQQAGAAFKSAETAVERGRARELLSKIKRFEGIRQRFVAIALAQAETDRVLEDTPGAEAPIQRRLPKPRFDGVGRLMPVIRHEAGLPPFALVDEAGEVLYYVTPAPGVNLRRYVGMVIGVNGYRGYIPSAGSQQVVVKNVQLLQRPTPRLR